MASKNHSSKSHRAQRCPWLNLKNPLYVRYHDREWGKPIRRDRPLFELLTLEGAQAGLSWEIVLNKRSEYRKVFHRFDPQLVAQMKPHEIRRLLKNPGIVRHHGKLQSTVSNARAFLAVQREFGSFSRYLWGFVDGKPQIRRPRSMKDYLARSPLSDAISKDLKGRGFKFVGSKIVYAYLQACGVLSQHTRDCEFA